jgi:hypothetical protein
VDSGQLTIIDPCYVAEEPLNYDDVCESTGNKDGYGSIFGELAVAFRTTFGDGLYPVYAEYDEDGLLTRVSVELT